MAAASGELELRASLIAHVLALGGLNVSQRWRVEVSCRFHMAQRPAAVFTHGLGIATCARAGEVVRAGSSVSQPCHSVVRLSPTVSSPNGVHRRKGSVQRCKVQIEFGRTEARGVPAADRLREPESVHDEVGLTSQQRGQRSVAGI